MNPLDDEDPEGCSDSLLVMMYASSPGRRRGRGRGLSSGEAVRDGKQRRRLSIHGDVPGWVEVLSTLSNATRAFVPAAYEN